MEIRSMFAGAFLILIGYLLPHPVMIQYGMAIPPVTYPAVCLSSPDYGSVGYDDRSSGNSYDYPYDTSSPVGGVDPAPSLDYYRVDDEVWT
jgi:hypothetical protein